MIEQKRFIFALVRQTGIKLLTIDRPRDPALNNDPETSYFYLQPGCYQLEKIESPYGTARGFLWYVLAGTMTGMGASHWENLAANPLNGLTLYFRKTKHIYALVKGNVHRFPKYPLQEGDVTEPLQAGYYELEMLPHPRYPGKIWYRIKETRIGGDSKYWHAWREREYGDGQIVIIYLREPLKRKRYKF